MKKILPAFFLIILGLFFLIPKNIEAATPWGECRWTVTDVNGRTSGYQRNPNSASTIRWTVTCPNSANTSLKVYSSGTCARYTTCQYNLTADNTGKVSGYFAYDATTPDKNIIIKIDETGSFQNPISTFTITPADWVFTASPTPQVSAQCHLSLIQNGNVNPTRVDPNTELFLKGELTNIVGVTNPSISCLNDYQCSATITGLNLSNNKLFSGRSLIVNSASPQTFMLSLGRNWPNDDYQADAKISMHTSILNSNLLINCMPLNYNIPGGVPNTSFCGGCQRDEDCSGICSVCTYCKSKATPTIVVPSLAPLCTQLPGQFQPECRRCVEQQGKIWTALGCLSPDFGSFISQQILGIGIGIGGGVAFLYFLYGAFLYLTSSGNPEQVAMAREIIMSSLLGLLLIIFSVYLLRVISIDILQLPDFTTANKSMNILKGNQ